jgi:hypothetical protein
MPECFHADDKIIKLLNCFPMDERISGRSYGTGIGASDQLPTAANNQIYQNLLQTGTSLRMRSGILSSPGASTKIRSEQRKKMEPAALLTSAHFAFAMLHRALAHGSSPGLR